jgi:ABC-type glutathione transport system ATPase component
MKPLPKPEGLEFAHSLLKSLNLMTGASLPQIKPKPKVDGRSPPFILQQKSVGKCGIEHFKLQVPIQLVFGANLHKHFGGFHAVDGASLEIAEGSITGLIGPNGAGKTTLFNVVAGVLEPTSGRVTMAGEDITGLPPHDALREGAAAEPSRSRTSSRR